MREIEKIEKYELIISISTLEHVGWDEKPKEPKKFLGAIKNLKNRCLVKGGKIIFTIPLGYNQELERILAKKQIHLAEVYFLKKVSSLNEWEEICLKIEDINKYNFHENVLLIGVFIKS